jgi:DNA-directed RNA polymerase subunit RPC12/RpoP
MDDTTPHNDSCHACGQHLTNNLDYPENRCPKCSQLMLLLRTFDKKICVDCCQEYDWHLKPGQPPLIQHQR